ncbi:uroporphyrinogen-III C-methyltransferase [Euzebyella marina]|uniref:uroporphyrinogen-III C-methyltransferase n=1 Tax=Euzebyella marina TaxID=1761453 RepID=A0A3G2L606_9FLAO|nr:uroporphyrinogen-III C-methyltransferase [Euzebyella marina]AYN67704.1 uroporphyrinogen-III C-methyltransferase [Euzebyella marina]
MEVNKEAKVTLVGAGPGSSDLITIRGLRAMENADVILYDALVDKELLSTVRGDIPKIYVGKRCGSHSVTQSEINKLLVNASLNYGHVVRLKGGDPFVFGRACEEIAYVESFGIPVSVVPGITSAISVPGSQGIPMTSRGVSTSFWVMTATKSNTEISDDFVLAAQSSSTMVVLMGIRKLDEIVRKASEYRGSDTPIAIIQNGTLKNESCAVGTLSTILNFKQQINQSMPGIIIIGNVVAKHPSFFNDEVQRVLFSAL